MKTVMLAAAAALAFGAASQAHADVFDFQLTSPTDVSTFSLNTANEMSVFLGFDYGTVPVTDNSGTTSEDVSTGLGIFLTANSFSFAASSGPFASDTSSGETFVDGTYQGGDNNGAPETLVISPPGGVSAAPEPAAWALMMAGVASIGLMLRRAKKTMGFRFRDAFAS